MSASFAVTIAEFAASLDRTELLSTTREALKLRLIDTVGCMLGAAEAEPVRIARAVARAYSGAPPDGPAASIVGAPGRFALEDAAFINGIAARFLDFNDIYLSKEAIHPSDNIPVGLALAQGLGRDGNALLRALRVGYEVHCRLADAVSTRAMGWDNVVLGAIAASVMASSLLDLSVEQRAQAIALAAVPHVALMQTRVGALSMWKAAASAYVGRGGLFATLHAAHGLSGPVAALDGTHGLFARVTGPADPAHFVLDGSDRIEDVHLKAYPAQYFTQTAIDAALALRPQIGPVPVERIRVGTFEFGRVAAADTVEKWHPSTRETADHSMPYCVAVALLDGAVGEDQFAADRITREDVQSLVQRVEVYEDPALTAQYPYCVPSRLTLVLGDGQVLEATGSFPLGHRCNPMRMDRVGAKFAALAAGRGAHLFDDLRAVEQLSGEQLGNALAQISHPVAEPG